MKEAVPETLLSMLLCFNFHLGGS